MLGIDLGSYALKYFQTKKTLISVTNEQFLPLFPFLNKHLSIRTGKDIFL